MFRNQVVIHMGFGGRDPHRPSSNKEKARECSNEWVMGMSRTPMGRKLASEKSKATLYHIGALTATHN